MSRLMCIENAFGKVFAAYGRFISCYPLPFIIGSLVVAGLLAIGLIRLGIESDVETLYTPQHSQASKDRAKIMSLFELKSSSDFYEHQIPNLGSFGEVIFVTKSPDDNVLTDKALRGIVDTFFVLKNFVLERDGKKYVFEDVCARRFNECVVEGSVALTDHLKQMYKNGNLSYPNFIDQDGKEIDLSYTLSGVKFNYNGTVSSANAVRLKFQLRQDTDEQRRTGFAWERKFLDTLKELQMNSTDFTYQVSQSLNNELNDNTGGDIFYFTITFVIMITYANLVSSGGDCVSSRSHLATAGVLAATLAIAASFGISSALGVKFVNIVGVMPFLVIGIGIDDMFILMASFRKTDPLLPAAERVAETFQMSGLPITVTTLTSLLAFCISATSGFLSIRNFCVYTGVALGFCYIFQLTFFGGCLVYHSVRVEQSRHQHTCRVVSGSFKELQEAGASCMEAFCCGGKRPEKIGEDESLCEKAPSAWLHKFILNNFVKAFILLIFGVYLGFGIWGATQIQEGLVLNNLVGENSYYNKYVTTSKTYFSSRGPLISFNFEKSVNYWETETQTQIISLLQAVKTSKYCFDDFEIGLGPSWLRDYLRYLEVRNLTNTSKNQFLSVLKTEFLPNFHVYQHDVRFDAGEITSSRLYVQSRGLNSSGEEGLMMLKMREFARESPLPVFAYTGAFIFYEQYVSIIPATLQTCGIAVAAMFLVGLLFIPHPLSIVYITITMVMILVGMFGYMHLWGLTLSAITMIQVILSIGFCVDFSAHMCHAFMQGEGTRNERATYAISKVGVPIMNSAISSILGIIIVAFASSYVFRSFFKTMFLVIIFGLGHALLFLPVILSLIGPPKPLPSVMKVGTDDLHQADRKTKENLSVQTSKPSVTSGKDY